MESKICTKCQQLKLLQEFNVKSNSKDRLTPWCKPCNSESARKWRLENPEKSRSAIKKYKKDNPDKTREISKRYKSKNIESVRKYQREYVRKRRAEDPLYKLSNNLRNLIRNSFRAKKQYKGSNTEELLGASMAIVMAHLVQTAINRYGVYDSFCKYEIDHIVPCCSAVSEAHMRELQHYTNLQLLTKEDNRRKSGSLSPSIL